MEMLWRINYRKVQSLQRRLKRTLNTCHIMKVHTGADWDLKNNTETIWGVAWNYDKANATQTTFSCNRFSNANAADVGNYHAGYTGIMAGIGKYILCKGAGLAETVKSFRNGEIFCIIQLE